MATGSEQTTRAKGYSGPDHRQPDASPITPPLPSPSAARAKDSGSERFSRAPFPDRPGYEEDPWAGLFKEISRPRRRWPAVVAFSLVGLAVTLIGVAAAGRLRPKIAATHNYLARALKPNQRQSTTAKSGFAAAVPSPIAPQLVATQATLVAPRVQTSNPAAMNNHNAMAPVSDKPTRTAQVAAPRRSSLHRASAHSNKSTWKSQAEAQHGVPVDQIYINTRGELVDVQGKPLRSETAPEKVPSSDAESAAK